nr:HAMP domain-containing sensor histidine kinase [Streptomyces sp. CBMA152]
MRRLPLRSRLALLVATAVAVAVAASALACWFVVRSTLIDSLDSALRSNRPGDRQVLELYGRGACTVAPPPAQERPSLFKYTIQVVTDTGQSCILAGTESLVVGTSDISVAAGHKRETTHNTTGADGTEYRALTTQIRGTNSALTVARPLTEVTSQLNTLTLVLAVVAGVGALGAGIAGFWVARTGLRPVDELADTVEHVARTEDLTVRIPAEGEDEIARLSRSFNAMTAALASSRDRQAQLIADAGHELRTPLTSLRTNVELLARSDETGRIIPPADRKALMVSVKAQMSELASLIGDLQELSRPDAVREGPLEVVGFHDITRIALDRARLRGPELTITAELAPWYVRAEPAKLERAVVNVLDNAVKFSPPGGTITVALDRGVLTVRDQGPGIPADELPHVFERFWRSQSARSLPGSGLGLSIVARTVEHAGGAIGLGPAPDGPGTVATIRLPGAPTPPPEYT